MAKRQADTEQSRERIPRLIQARRKSPAGVRFRSVEPPEIGIAGLDIALRVRGVQYTDGRVEYRLVLIGDGRKELDSSSAREVAAALMSAAQR